MIQFTESDLIFNFPKKWQITKYDAHPFYQRLSGAGMKGVDFMGIYEEKDLVLIEVKNYRIRYDEKPPTEIYHILDNPEVLVEKIRLKAEDTMQVIRVINKYYARKKWYKLLHPLYSLLRRTPYYLQTPRFWQDAQHLIETNQFSVILWLETESEYEIFTQEEVVQFRQNVQRIAQEKYPNLTIHLLDRNTKQVYFEEPISVQIDDLKRT